MFRQVDEMHKIMKELRDVLVPAMNQLQNGGGLMGLLGMGKRPR